MHNANLPNALPVMDDMCAIYEGEALATIMKPFAENSDAEASMQSSRIRGVVAKEPGWSITRFVDNLIDHTWTLTIRSPFGCEYLCENLTDVAAAIMDYTDALVLDNAALHQQRMESKGEFRSRFGRYPTNLELDLWLDGKYYPMGDMLTHEPGEDEVYAYIGQ